MPKNQPTATPTRAVKSAGEKASNRGVPPSDVRASQLSILIERRPQSKLGQLRFLWPEIKSALRNGHQLKQVWNCVAEDGIQLSYSKFRTYVARLKKWDASGAELNGQTMGTQAAQAAKVMSSGAPDLDTPKRDALANLRARMQNRPGFEFDERPPDEKKLI